MKDCIFFEDFEVLCKVGTTREERAFPQVASISLKAYLPLKEAGESDDLNKSVDYVIIRDQIQAKLGEGEYHLVEAVAEDISKIVLALPMINSTEVTVRKNVFAGVKAVGITIYRAKQ